MPDLARLITDFDHKKAEQSRYDNARLISEF